MERWMYPHGELPSLLTYASKTSKPICWVFVDAANMGVWMYPDACWLKVDSLIPYPFCCTQGGPMAKSNAVERSFKGHRHLQCRAAAAIEEKGFVAFIVMFYILRMWHPREKERDKISTTSFFWIKLGIFIHFLHCLLLTSIYSHRSHRSPTEIELLRRSTLAMNQGSGPWRCSASTPWNSAWTFSGTVVSRWTVKTQELFHGSLVDSFFCFCVL